MSTSASPSSPARRSAHSRTGMVTSPHALATQAGVDVLSKGGNAIEAPLPRSLRFT